MITKIQSYLTELDKKLTMEKLDKLMSEMVSPETYVEYVILKGDV